MHDGLDVGTWEPGPGGRWPGPGGANRDRGFTANGHARASRAAQFMPFAALTGYYELARQQERITEPRHELTEEEALALSRTITQIKKGDLVRVTFYDWDAYRTVSGVVARVDFAFRRIQVVKTVIGFDDILAIER